MRSEGGAVHHRIVPITFVLLALMVAGCGGGETETVTVTSPSIDAGPSSDEGATTSTSRSEGAVDVAINAVGRDGGLQYRVSKVIQTTGQLPVSEFSDPLKPAKGAKFVVVDVTVKNVGAGPTMPFCGGTGTILIDAADRNFQTDGMNMISLAKNSGVLCDNLNPGFRSSMQLLFEVPSDASPTAVALWDTDEDDDFNGQNSWIRVRIAG